MCNFYMMYWAEGGVDNLLQAKYCFKAGAPYYYWKTGPKLKLKNLPDESNFVENLQRQAPGNGN